MNGKLGKIGYWVLFSFTTIVMGVALFAKLGAFGVCFTDEATHGVNAYEMVQNGNLWINTLRYEVDYYNTKPPLMLWLIILGYKIFGFNAIGLRFFSALAGLITYLVLFTWVYRVRGKVQAILFASFLPACTGFFEFHMFRAGDMDAVYTMFFVIAMIALYNSLKNIRYMLLYGIGFGLAFMTKSSHAANIIGIGILFAPFLIKLYGYKKVIIQYIVSYIAGALVLVPWVIVRFRFDGLAFFSDILFDETIGRVQGNLAEGEFVKYFFYIKQTIKEPICLICILIILVAVLMKLIKDIRQKQSGEVVIVKEVKYLLVDPYLCLNVFWIIVVMGVYSMTKAGLDWYIYSSYIALMLLGVEAIEYIIRNTVNRWPFMKVAFTGVLIIAAMIISFELIRYYPWKGHGGMPIMDLHDELLQVKERAEQEYSKKTAYFESSHNVTFEPQRWEHDAMFYGVTILDLICKDGGVQAFLETEDKTAVLILDKDLWETYAPVLTGHVILQDSSYIMFSKRKYGE
ncbi:MAG: glycosyltransferase family 39 protein [Lachnospiraceae bacterium]|nr:glycosyltransferase family 39 protein [Lachnospiraceae bacterium]